MFLRFKIRRKDGKEHRAWPVVESWAAWAGFCFIGVLLPFCWALDKSYGGPLRRFLLAFGQSKFATMPEKP
ncbi:MAG: hypothetical protein ACRECP_03190 [Methylocella sp.]